MVDYTKRTFKHLLQGTPNNVYIWDFHETQDDILVNIDVLVAFALGTVSESVQRGAGVDHVEKRAVPTGTPNVPKHALIVKGLARKTRERLA